VAGRERLDVERVLADDARLDVGLGVALDELGVAVGAGAADPEDALVGEDLGEDGHPGPVPPLLEGDRGREQAHPDVGDPDVLPGDTVEGVIPDGDPRGRGPSIRAGPSAAERESRRCRSLAEKRAS